MDSEGVGPYMPSLEVCRQWFGLRLEGLTPAEAWRRIRYPGATLRPMARTLVAGAHGQPPLTLSIPILGGASSIKRGHPGRWRLSAHGRWPDVHFGALETAYSSTPYFIHCAERFKALYDGVNEGDPFAEFTAGTFSILNDFLDLESIIKELRELRVPGKEKELERLKALKNEKCRETNADLSIFDVIFRKGKESIFWIWQ